MKIHLAIPALIILLLGALNTTAQVNYQPEVTEAELQSSRGANVVNPPPVVVGSIPGTAEVTDNGAATYNIPIQVSPGTNGMQPRLAITYNSQGSDGVLGRGWSLAGASSIVRVGRNLHFDDAVAGVEWSYNDRFVLDGNRLMAADIDYGNDGTYYFTENYTFNDIQSHGTLGNGPDHFTMLTTEGLSMEYGNDNGTNNARVLGYGENEAWVWHVNKVVDVYGNYMLYEYEYINSESVMTTIRYTGNDGAGLTPYITVEFEYGTRTDQNHTYASGALRRLNNLLTAITVKDDQGNIINHYDLEYCLRQLPVSGSYLRQITRTGSEGEQFNPTLIKYGDMPSNSGYSLGPAKSGEEVDIFSADFDGDGRSDLLRMPYVYVFKESGPKRGLI